MLSYQLISYIWAQLKSIMYGQSLTHLKRFYLKNMAALMGPPLLESMLTNNAAYFHNILYIIH